MVYVNDLLEEVRGVSVPDTTRESPFDPPVPRLRGLLWADDTAFLTESEEDMVEALQGLDRWCSKWMMKTNAKKSAVLITRPEGEDEEESQPEDSPFSLEGSPVAILKSYKYLGVIVQDNLEWKLAEQARIRAVQHTTTRHTAVLRCRSCSHFLLLGLTFIPQGYQR